MKIGKVPNGILKKRVFAHLRHKREDVIKNPWIGEDTAIVDYGEELCVLSVDPITGASKGIGKLAVHIACNDVATAGAEPVGLMITLLLPPNTTEEELEEIMKEVAEEAETMNVAILGGHTEVTDAVNRITIVANVVGRMKKEALLSAKDVKDGDVVAMTKAAALEGTWIAATEYPELLRKKFSEQEWERIMGISQEISVVRDGHLGARYGAKYMHDITEGGILGAVWEAGEAIGKGIALDVEAVPIRWETLKVLEEWPEVDPLALISSGSMLIIVAWEDYPAMEAAFKRENIAIKKIGEITGEGMVYRTDTGEIIREPGSDHLYRLVKF